MQLLSSARALVARTLSPKPEPAVRSLPAQQTPPAPAREETPLRAAVRAFALAHNMSFYKIEDGKAVFSGYRAADYKDYPPVALDRIPELQHGLELMKNFFVRLKAEGTKKIPIDGDMPFQIFSPFGDFYERKPADRRALAGSSGGIDGYFAVKPEVDIDLILRTYDDLIEECRKALRAGSALSHAATPALGAPKT